MSSPDGDGEGDSVLTRRWFSIRETAEHFGEKPAFIYSLVARGMFPGGAVIHAGRKIKVDVAAIEAGGGFTKKAAKK